MPKITDYPDGGPLQDTDELVVARDGQNYKVAGAAAMGASLSRDPATGNGLLVTPNNSMGGDTIGITVQMPTGINSNCSSITVFDGDTNQVFEADTGGTVFGCYWSPGFGFWEINPGQLQLNPGGGPSSVLSAESLMISSGGDTILVNIDGTVKLPNLPTSNPNVAGQLWNNGGVLQISAG